LSARSPRTTSPAEVAGYGGQQVWCALRAGIQKLAVGQKLAGIQKLAVGQKLAGKSGLIAPKKK
jgi:hypothetical protein